MKMNNFEETPSFRPFRTVRRYRSRLRPLTGRPDLTALIDVMFLMLIFFMLSSSFVQVSGIRVDLPRVNASSTADIEKFIVAVSHAGGRNQIYFNDRPVDWEMLKENLAAVSGLSQSATVVIRADRQVPFEVVTQIMALAERARLASFIAVMPEQLKPDTTFSRKP